MITGMATDFSPRTLAALLRAPAERSWRQRRLVRRAVDTEPWRLGSRHTAPGLAVGRYSASRLCETQEAVLRDATLSSRLHAGLVRDLTEAENESALVPLLERVKWWEDQAAEVRLTEAAKSQAWIATTMTL